MVGLDVVGDLSIFDEDGITLFIDLPICREDESTAIGIGIKGSLTKYALDFYGR